MSEPKSRKILPVNLPSLLFPLRGSWHPLKFSCDVNIWWTQYLAEVNAEKEAVRVNEDKQKQKICAPYLPIRFILTLTITLVVHARLIKAEYSAGDFPV